jgi:hypothetical protein
VRGDGEASVVHGTKTRTQASCLDEDALRYLRETVQRGARRGHFRWRVAAMLTAVAVVLGFPRVTTGFAEMTVGSSTVHPVAVSTPAFVSPGLQRAIAERSAWAGL